MKNIPQWLVAFSLGMLCASVAAGPIPQELNVVSRDSAATNRLVFAHFMVSSSISCFVQEQVVDDTTINVDRHCQQSSGPGRL
jgi:hypothetical protein